MPATLWKPTLVALGAATVLTAGWILLPTTVNETSAPAQELPAQAQQVIAQARAGDIEKVTVDAAAGTFTITGDDGTIDTLTVDTRQGPTVAVQLAAAGIDVTWPTVTPPNGHNRPPPHRRPCSKRSDGPSSPSRSSP